MAPAAYSIGATPPLKREERDQRSFPFTRRTQHHPASPTLDVTDDGAPLASPAKRNFFQRLAGGTGKKGEKGEGGGGGGGGESGRVPWETTSSREHGTGSFGMTSTPDSPTRMTKAAMQQYPRPRRTKEPSRDDKPQHQHRFASPKSSPPTLHSTHRLPYQHHHSRSSASSSADGYSLLFTDGMNNVHKRGGTPAVAAGYGSDDEYGHGRVAGDGADADDASLSPSKRALRSLVKKSSKFSLRSLVHAGSGGTGGGGHSPPASPSLSYTFGSVGTSPQTQSLPLPTPSSSSHHLHLGRRPSIPPPRSAQAAYYPREISSPSSTYRPPPSQVGGSFLTPLPSPNPRERKTSATSARSAPALWALGGGGEEAQKAKGSVRGKAAKLLGEEIVPSGKAAKILGMERKKTLVKKPSARSLTAESFDSHGRRPSVAPSLSTTITSYDSPLSSFPPTPAIDDTLTFASSPLRRRSVSTSDLLLTPTRSTGTKRPFPSSPPTGHRNLYADDEDDDVWRPPSPPSSSPPQPAQGSETSPTEDRSSSFTPTSDYAGSFPRARSPSTSSGYSFPPRTRASRTNSSSTRSSSYHQNSDSPERVLSYASSSYGIPSQFFPFQVSPPPGSPTLPYLPTTPGTGGFTTFSSNPHRLSPDSIRFSALGMQMSPDAFSSPSSYSLAGSSNRTSVLGGASSPSRSSTTAPKRPSLGPRGYSASSVLSSSTSHHSPTGSAPSSHSSHVHSQSHSRSSSSVPSTSTSATPTPPTAQLVNAFPTPPTSPPPLIPTAAYSPSSTPSGMARSNTLVSIASSHTRRKQRTNALDALEGRGGSGSYSFGEGAAAVGEGRGGRKRALEQRGLRALREEEGQGAEAGRLGGGGAGGDGSAGSGTDSKEKEGCEEREGKERKRLAMRESRPFLDLDFSSGDEEDVLPVPAIVEGDKLAMGEDQQPDASAPRGRQRETTASSRLTTSSSSSSRATSLAPSWPPPNGPLPPSPLDRSRPPSTSTATSASSGGQKSTRTVPPPAAPPPASQPPPPPRSTSLNKLHPAPPPPEHPYARPLSPTSSPLPPPSTSSPRRAHNRDLSAASYASISPSLSGRSILSAASSSPSSDGFSIFSSLEATANAFPAPPSGGSVQLPWTQEEEDDAVAAGGEGEYRFPPPTGEDKAARMGLGLLALDANRPPLSTSSSESKGKEAGGKKLVKQHGGSRRGSDTDSFLRMGRR